MRHRLLRAFVTLTTLAVVWLVASPARAASAANATNAAPLCDPRGAIVFAPPPQMQDLEVSLDVPAAEDDCTSGASPARMHHVTRDRAPVPIDASASPERVSPPSLAFPALDAGAERIPAPVASKTCSRPGFRSTVDRPPRA